MSSCARATVRLAALALLLLTGFASAARAETPATVLGCGMTGRIHVFRDDIVLESNHLFESVRDYANWREPGWIGWNQHGLTFYWSEVVSDGELLVAVNPDASRGPCGFAIYDFADLGAPVETGVTLSMPFTSAWLRDRALYVSVENAVIVYDVSVAEAPAFSGIVMAGSLTGPRRFSALGSTLYFVDQATDLATTLRAVDVTDPRHPIDRGPCLSLSGRVDAMAAGDGVLYTLVSMSGAGDGRSVDLATLSAAVPGQPVEAGRIQLCAAVGAAGRALRRDGALLLAATSDGRVRAFGVAVPAAPEAGWALDHDVQALDLSRHAMFVETADGLYTYGRVPHDETPGAPEFRAPLPRLTCVAGDGPIQIAQVRGDDAHLWPLDVSNPQLPRIEKPIETGLSGSLQYADGLGLLRQDSSSMRLLDLADPRQPRVCAEVPRWGRTTGAMVLHDAVLAVSNRNSDEPAAFRLYDVSDPENPVLRSTVMDGDLRYGDRRWLVCGLGLGGADKPRLWKLDDDLQATLCGLFRTAIGVVNPVCIVGDHAYLFGQDRNDDPLIEVHDLSGIPRLVRTIRPGMIARHIAQQGAQLIVAGNSWCQVYDVSTPSDPQEVKRFYLGGEPVGIARNGNVATICSNLVTVRTPASAAAAVPPPLAPTLARLLPPQPNPFNPRTTIAFTLDRAHDLSVTVYDVRGRHVRDLTTGRFEAGPHAVEWDGRTAGGAAVASGTYFVRLHGPGVEAVQSVTLVK